MNQATLVRGGRSGRGAALAALLALAWSGAPAAAQQAAGLPVDTVRPGDLSFDLGSRTDSSVLSILRPDTVVSAGRYTSVTSRVRLGARDALLVVEVLSGGRSLDSIWAAPRSLAPLKHVGRAGGTTVDVTWDGTRVTGSWTDTAGTHAVDTTLAAPAFDQSVAQLVLEALPLVPGYRARIVTYDAAHGPGWIDVEVRGEATMPGSKDRRVWVVEVRPAGLLAGLHYIDETSRRELGWDIQVGEGEAARLIRSRLSGSR
jgi:hypothetical protein